jgi:hypothetical protein
MRRFAATKVARLEELSVFAGVIRGLVWAWALLFGPIVGFIAAQRYIGLDCGLSPTAGDDIAATFGRAADAIMTLLTIIGHSLNSLTPGGLLMPKDPMTLLLWLVLAGLALAALAWWLRNRSRSTQAPPESPIEEPVPVAQPERRAGRDYKLAIGSAGVKSIVREARMEEAYQVRTASETAFEAFADFDNQQERIAVANRPPGPGALVLSETLEAQSSLSEGLGNRTPADVWAMREEWMPALSHFVEESAFSLRAQGIWPARVTAELSAGGHGVPGLYALSQVAVEFPRADRHAHFIVPEGDVERLEALRLMDALRYGDLHSEALPWKANLPLALTTLLRDNRQGRENLDEVAAHIAPALNARVRYATATSENLSNLMRRLTKHGPHADSEPCPLTFHFARTAVPVNVGAQSPHVSVDRGTLLPLADATLRALRSGDGVTRALEVDIARHLVLVTVPCTSWEDVERVEEYVLERLEFSGSQDRSCTGILFSGYRPDANSREERILAIRLGTVAGGWDAVYRCIRNAISTVDASLSHERTNGKILSAPESVR